MQKKDEDEPHAEAGTAPLHEEDKERKKKLLSPLPPIEAKGYLQPFSKSGGVLGLSNKSHAKSTKSIKAKKFPS